MSDLAGIALVPVPVEGLGHDAELDDEVAGEVLGLDLAALFPPEAQQGRLVIAHDDPGVRAADELTSINIFEKRRYISGDPRGLCHGNLPRFGLALSKSSSRGEIQKGS